MLVTEKPIALLSVKSKYVYRIYTNGNSEKTIEVQLKDSFKRAEMGNFALLTMTNEDYEKRMTAEKINDIFLMLRKNILETGKYYELSPLAYEFIAI